MADPRFLWQDDDFPNPGTPIVYVRPGGGEYYAPPDPGQGGPARPSAPPRFEAPDPSPATPEPPAASPEPIDEVVVSARPPPSIPLPPIVSVAPLGTLAQQQLTSGARPAPRTKPRPRPIPRRSKPAPKPSRRPRPTTRPAPRGPRIRIPVAPIARALLGRVAGVAALVPTLFAALTKLDQFGTEGWYERIYGVPLDDRDNQRSRNTRPNPDGGGATSAWSPVGPAFSEDPVGEVVVSGRAPARVPVNAVMPAPVAIPRVGPVPFEIALPEAVPSAPPAVKPGVVSEPSLVPKPIPQPIGNPQLVPAPEAQPSPSPAPRPRPSTPRPLPNLDIPIVNVQPSLMPQPAAQPEPSARADPCNCPKPKKDKKPKKKRKDREKCFRGSYTEFSKGLVKRRREEVDCKTGKPKKPPAAANEEF